MNSEIPKQYLSLANRPIIEHTINVFAASPRIQSIVVALSPDDIHWDRFGIDTGEKVRALRCGGDSRAATVLNALEHLKPQVAADAWVLVHDAVRPGLSPDTLERLLTTLEHDPVGGILAIPLADTLKRAGNDQQIARTEPRDDLWLAQTPQMFRYGILREALLVSASLPTDESQAVEALGLHPRLVLGEARNFKITYPQDLQLAEVLLGANLKEDA